MRKPIPLAATALAVVLAGCASAPSADDAVTITLSTSASGHLLLDYRAPVDVRRLQWLDRNERDVKLVREAMLRVVDDCGSIEGDELVLGDSPACDHRAHLEVVPKVLRRNAMNEAAQPSSDGGVLAYTMYYAATASGHGLRWRFLPPQGGYVIDAARLWDRPREVTVDADTVDASLRTLDAESSWQALHASHSVYLGRMPVRQEGELLWARDAALPQPLTDAVAEAARAAMLGFAKASGKSPGGAAIVMLQSSEEGAGFHGDRTDERMIRLSFVRSAQAPSAHELQSARRFVAHEIAHLWNHGVFGSDMKAPWLHEGDAEWASGLVLRQQSMLDAGAWREQLEAAVNGCLLVRGQRPGASIRTEWGSGQDDPYACGTALQLLSWAEQHARDPRLEALGAWGALHRAHPQLDTLGFARFGDGPADHRLQHLMLDAGVPFAPAYLEALSALMPLQRGGGEPANASLRGRIAGTLMQRLQASDCGGQVSFWSQPDHFALDADLACNTLPRGAKVARIAGEPVFDHPLAAWHAAQSLCAQGQRLPLGLLDGATFALACPKELPAAPELVTFAPDALERLGLAAATSR